jgi:hypothetical protein
MGVGCGIFTATVLQAILLALINEQFLGSTICTHNPSIKIKLLDPGGSISFLS